MEHIPDLPREVPNYAWSFELIIPENGLILESNGLMMEVSFDWLMFREAQAVLGNSFRRFGNEFPIRFDFLDTIGGGNLSIQVHPREEYIKKHFGENFTQQEAYYILDTCGNATVNLGFREGTDPQEFRTVMEYSAANQTPKVTLSTKNKCHVLSLVEGRSITVLAANGAEQRFSYAETFIIPAATGHYTVVNEGASEALLVIAFMKDDQ
jgi:mannose-6-phosphate isomerase class I